VMTIGKAKTFIRRAMTDSEMRSRLNAAPSIQVRDDILAAENLLFSPAEFEDAYRHQLTECQNEETAGELKEFKLWWDYLASLISPVSCGNGCRACSG
jgi:hypothetical protein